MNAPDAIIDAPVGPYSDPHEIRAWIEELRALPESGAIRRALTDAEEMLNQRLARDEQ